MKNLLTYGTVFFVLIAGFSCGRKTAVSTAGSPIEEKIGLLQQIPISPNNKDSLLRTWKKLLGEQPVKESKLYTAKVNYQLARLYGMAGLNDSSALHLEKAFQHIEAEKGHWDEKARIYQGIGNLGIAEGHLHRANYYYNKAAAIVLADSSVALEPSAKAAILLAAAQSNQQFQRLDLAQEMNRKALSLSELLPEKHINRHRPITQLIQNLYHTRGNMDSMAYYIERLEALQIQYPDVYDPYFLYESKALLHSLRNEPDAALNYQLLKIAPLENALNNGESSGVMLSNLFISYVNIAGIYTAQQNRTKATEYFAKANHLLSENKTVLDYDHLIVYHQNVADYYTGSGDLKAALRSTNEVVRLQSELYDRQNTQAIAEMNSLYEIQAQERSIQQLNESLQIKELELQQNRLWMMVSLLAAVLLAMILFFIYYGFRQRRIQQEKDQVILQQQLLRTQMEPHFIFNTLTALQHYIRQGHAKEAISYLSQFSKLLRNSLEISREQLVSLTQEVETLQYYLTLQQMRFENAFTYTLDLPEGMETDEIRIPPMLIQPFVENAILHGVDMKSGKGFVHIAFSEERDMLYVEMIDSGRAGKQPHTTGGHRSLSGIISRERLALLGNGARVETRKNEDGGTRVTLMIPVS
ncbi:histidine kinase [Parapedobacter pyrenivorans]|uniref:histidine kinase n=1 Tax=Parapedobacter pyrenivorans TaxID=1305674 RepID=UPI00333FE8C7